MVSDWHKLIHGYDPLKLSKISKCNPLFQGKAADKSCDLLPSVGRMKNYKFSAKVIFLSFLLSQLPSSGRICSYTLETSLLVNPASLKPWDVILYAIPGYPCIDIAAFTVFFFFLNIPWKMIAASVSLVKSLKMIKRHNLTPAHRGVEGPLTIKKCDVFNSIFFSSSSWLWDPLATGVSHYFPPTIFSWIYN